MPIQDEQQITHTTIDETHIPTAEQAQFYVKLLQHVRESIIVTDMQGKIVHWNEGASSIFGYSSAEMLGKTPSLIYPEVDEQQLAHDLQRILAGQDYIGEWKGRCKDGSRVWIDIKTTVLRNQAGEAVGFIGVGTDITVRKQAEEASHQLLQRLEIAYEETEQARKNAEAERQLLSDLFSQAPAGIAILRGPAHIYEMANSFYHKIVGKTDLLGKPGREAIPELTSQGVWDIFDRIYTTGEVFVGKEFPAQLDRRGDGTLEQAYFNFVGQPIRNVDGTIGRILIHAVEVTDLVQARQRIEQLAYALELERARLEAVLQQMPSGVVIAEAPSGKLIMGNKQVEEILRRPMSLSASISDYDEWQGFHSDGRPMLPEEWPLARAIRQGEVVLGEEVDYQRGDQTRGTLRIGAAPIRDEQGNIAFGVAVFHDITEQKELERRKDEFITMASHELKTPVTSIKGFTQILQRRFRQRDDAESLRFLARMDDQLNKLTKLISDMLDISRMQRGQLVYREELFNLDALAQEIVENLQGTTQTHHLLLEHTVRTPVFGDRDRIGQVLINLLTNAVKYSPQADRILVRVAADTENTIVSVQDFGIGISDIHRENVFERFYQVNEPTEKTYPGMGIGLYISSEIVKRHHGHIWVESTKGAGSTFHFTLPLAKNRSPEA